MSATVNPWIGVFIVLGIPLLIYLYSRKRMNTPKAGLIAITTYILLGLALIALGWNVSPYIIVLPGLFVALLDVLQLRSGTES
ncbi:hypothetical protein E3E36_07795 [Thermococcus sp. M36]|uniref:hypothetical protein n=1 Tax=Thermococcus sp. M36 TaxID=1638261 RepID=UPI00143B437E|nr:hypothetical protein [Thermococcus sp. M36]NJE06040.1 hypothetical protein [Thermococcus sp. M36]